MTQAKAPFGLAGTRPLAGEAELLRLRAQKLARANAEPEQREQLHLLLFTLGRETYAVESGFVEEVLPMKEITRLPCTPAFVLGIANLHGRILPVLDLKVLFALPREGGAGVRNAIVLSHGEMAFGILADGLQGIRSLSLSDLHPNLPTAMAGTHEYVRGISADQIVVLDAGKLLADPKLIVNEQVE